MGAVAAKVWESRSQGPEANGGAGDERGVTARGGVDLFPTFVRVLAEARDARVVPLLKGALASEDGGGPSVVTAACFTNDPSLSVSLTKLAAARQAHLAFCAETARVYRGESQGGHLAAVAPMIKEAHRIGLCLEVFVPLLREEFGARSLNPALRVLRDAERHLGRWLVLGELAVLGGDETVASEAAAREKEGPTTARAAWSYVTWALAQGRGGRAAQGDALLPKARPTVELVARLSDRPSGDRDTAFLFRLAEGGVASVKVLLEARCKVDGPMDDAAMRAAYFLIRDHGRDDLRDGLRRLAAVEDEAEDLRGLAIATLWDLGERKEALAWAEEAEVSSQVATAAWGALVRARGESVQSADEGTKGPMVDETRMRWIQRGWLE
jgi:hypothetical protein